MHKRAHKPGSPGAPSLVASQALPSRRRATTPTPCSPATAPRAPAAGRPPSRRSPVQGLGVAPRPEALQHGAARDGPAVGGGSGEPRGRAPVLGPRRDGEVRPPVSRDLAVDSRLRRRHRRAQAARVVPRHGGVGGARGAHVGRRDEARGEEARLCSGGEGSLDGNRRWVWGAADVAAVVLNVVRTLKRPGRDVCLRLGAAAGGNAKCWSG